jgi:hypothetical protein
LRPVTASGVSGVDKGTSDIAAAAATRAAQAGVQNGHAGAGVGSAYFVDTMFRSTKSSDGDNVDSRAEATRILVRSIQDGRVVLSPGDPMAQMVAAPLSQPEAKQRVDTVVNQLNDAEQKVRQTADCGRKVGRAAVHCHRAINVDRCVHCQRGSSAWWKDPGRILTPSRRIEPACIVTLPRRKSWPVITDRRWDGLNHHRCAHK